MFPQAFHVGIPGWYHILVMGVLIPLVVVRNYRRMVGKSLALPNRMRHFRTTAIMLVLLTSLSVLVARAEWIDLYRFDSAKLPQGLAAGAVMYVVAVVAMRPRWRRAVERRSRIVHLFMPDTAKERAWWFLVSTLAGVGEEITWRGVQTALLAYITGSFVAGAMLCAASCKAMSPPLIRIVSEGAPPASWVARRAMKGASSPQPEPGVKTKWVWFDSRNDGG